jgi:external thioesterase TEII
MFFRITNQVNYYHMSATQLFVIHFAGGSSYSFRPIMTALEDVEVIPLELPGRGRRMHETLLTDFDEAANDIYNQLLDHIDDRSFSIYGHSLGASLAYKVCSLLEAIGEIPVSLVLSGNPGPGVTTRRAKSKLEEKEFIEEVRKLGGVPPELLDSKEFLHFILPILRADFTLSENGDLQKVPVVNTPIYAIMGDEEEHVGHIDSWQYCTHTDFNYKTLPGGHFFIDQHPGEMANIIMDSIKHHVI